LKCFARRRWPRPSGAQSISIPPRSYAPVAAEFLAQTRFLMARGVRRELERVVKLTKVPFRRLGDAAFNYVSFYQQVRGYGGEIAAGDAAGYLAIRLDEPCDEEEPAIGHRYLPRPPILIPQRFSNATDISLETERCGRVIRHRFEAPEPDAMSYVVAIAPGAIDGLEELARERQRDLIDLLIDGYLLLFSHVEELEKGKSVVWFNNLQRTMHPLKVLGDYNADPAGPRIA
jgi:hypothetical protein